ncbi:hypothetical protein B0H14DRAFT_2209012, partial [Mycena olivaceomarginata]
HVAQTFGYLEARLYVTAMPDVANFIVESVLIPFDDPSKSICELCISGDCLTWKELMELLEEVQGVKSDIKYLDPAHAIEKQEAAHAAGNSEGELHWSTYATIANSYALLPESSDNHRFSFKPKTVKETLEHLFEK